MRHNETVFFCDTGHENAPKAKIVSSGPHWPYAIRINNQITIYVNEQQLIAFKNSVISEYENLRR